jgi:putative SOS response-associated peptidase YedK
MSPLSPVVLRPKWKARGLDKGDLLDEARIVVLDIAGARAHRPGDHVAGRVETWRQAAYAEAPSPNFPPSWNVAPTDSLPIVRFNPKDDQRSLDLMRWGLIPYWAKDIKVGFANINAKAEGIEKKPAFGKAFERRRCLVPVDN